MIVNLCLFITVIEISPQFRENGKNSMFSSFSLKQNKIKMLYSVKNHEVGEFHKVILRPKGIFKIT